MKRLPPDGHTGLLASLFTRAHLRGAFKKACEAYDLVYFGSVDQHSDEHQLVRGFTLSPSHKDAHFSVGTVSGRDVIFLHRSDTLTFPGKREARYSWVILQVDLRVDSLPHSVIDAGHYDQIFYDTLFTKFARLNKISSTSLREISPAFAQHFSVYTPPDRADGMLQLLAADTAATLAQHFHRFDIEWFQDRLIIYAPHPRVNARLFDDMLRLGVWLAGQLENGAKTVL